MIGIDEAGRGSWAGPLVAAAVGWQPQPPADLRQELNDSKQLSPQRRQQLFELIIASRPTWIGVGWVGPSLIDQIGLTKTEELAMTWALENSGATNQPVIIDGSVNYLADRPQTKAIVKADEKIAAVMAAGIIAKVVRDRFLLDVLDGIYNGYGLGEHKGYGTANHRRALESNGPTRGLHRQSWRPLISLTTQRLNQIKTA